MKPMTAKTRSQVEDLIATKPILEAVRASGYSLTTLYRIAKQMRETHGQIR